ncbi:bifunctional diaminohydroxyphosphoribosylaminopyrimidine deaminase/5-amino-6-(5-phosphoribosylamino)uracil reductase RibD [Caulobacter segnis]|uniref:bifunctional diaminohydroxyphosphoribosylaminopyrimidine deaminase/5-amino-6-(5-phosphoribosylamino)uracil reductase RibD n=1 Tax=Caulobacter segnis TaxID=88688 RepID=UPI00240EB093|nr:bifunctional diaminohydroxyphosphoribosylaminopyrimidine deaminase/5-amino-6-(5-phosphoribosylamino)uracil reductase RibD [Caulobacter segnis]MDG2523228.1 bifunctional diaminohydroxyphosphoribosylaminopyrimidine deaminase/5-amino-6-(5-phosphoribosylamino)uracil reductase RibD [Caulobacter segnis]
MSSEIDIQHMRRAIAVARTNLGKTWPNPVVGCVITDGETVLAEAATGVGGRPHAEEQAVAALGGHAPGVTAYVTLEPCGARTSGAPSCSQHLVSAGVKRVVIACEDPSPFASGQGTHRLRAAGLQVETGLLADEAFVLCAGFVHKLKTGRPLVEAAAGPEGYEAEFELSQGEGLDAALARYADLGHTRLWTPAGGETASRLHAAGLL